MNSNLDNGQTNVTNSGKSGSDVQDVSLGGKDTETKEGNESELPTYHRYYHVFREGELVQLIEKYVSDLHVLDCYFDHSNWCVVAEKVNVWKI